MRVDVGQDFHGEGLMRTVLVVLPNEGVEACLLLEDVRGRGLRRLLLQREMHPLMTAVVLRVAGLLRSM